jgi:hypothetical protein
MAGLRSVRLSDGVRPDERSLRGSAHIGARRLHKISRSHDETEAMRTTWLLAGCLVLASCREPNPAFESVGLLDGAAQDMAKPPPSDGPPLVDTMPPDPVGGAGGGNTPPTDAAGDDETPPPPEPDASPPVFDLAPVIDVDPVVDMAPVVDMNPVVDVTAPMDLAPDVFTPPAGCGTGTAKLTGIENADGLVVDTDGVIYFLTDDTNNSYVGRIPVGGTPDPTWLRVDNSPTTWGLALDSPRHRLYVLIVDGKGALIYYDDIKTTPKGGQLVVGIDDGNDVVVGPDGTVYYTQQGDRNVYSAPPSGGPPKLVTRSGPVGTTSAKPAAITVAPDGALLVGVDNSGPIYKITLTAGGVEAGRMAIGTWMGWANGLAFDHGGRLYVSIYHDTDPRSVVRLDADGKTTTTISSGGRFSSIGFGRGPLDCRDIYIADPYGPMRRVRVNDSL